MSSKPPDQSAKPGTYRLVPRGNDLAPLADLWVASWQATMPTIDFGSRRDWFRSHVLDVESRGGVTLCAMDWQTGKPDELLGFILLDFPRAILEQIAIAPALFGSGVGAFLLDEAKRRCPAGLSLDVNADNPRALRFYEKHGFSRAGSGLNPFSGLPIWRMRWHGA